MNGPNALLLSWHANQCILDTCGIMFKILFTVLFEVQLPLIAALFTVEVLQSNYSAEYGHEVTMGCRFPVPYQFTLTEVSVLWKKKLLQNQKEVYKIHKGQEDLSEQDTDYQGRATVLHEELKNGLSLLRIGDLKFTDAGSYLCIVDYQEEADYKYITLEIEAPYKTINLQSRREAKEVILTCHSEGFPLAEVLWHSKMNPNITKLANTTYNLTSDGIYNITSVLKVKPSIQGNYSCVFWNKKLNERTSAQISVHLPDQTDGLIPISIILPVCLLGLFFVILLLITRRK
uniref:Programmed cell death 1 ligand 2 n=1 Tax=Salvator merianae TaxID=96440 RepID=A0A8D0C916_SALMN